MPIPTESLPPSETPPAPGVIITKARALHQAALSASPQVVEGMLNQGTDINTKADVRNTETDGGRIPPHSAAMWNPEVAALLLDRGADIEAKTEDGWIPLHISTAIGIEPTVTDLPLDRGADTNAKTDTDSTPCESARRRDRFTGTPLLDRLCRPQRIPTRILCPIVAKTIASETDTCERQGSQVIFRHSTHYSALICGTV